MLDVFGLCLPIAPDDRDHLAQGDIGSQDIPISGTRPSLAKSVATAPDTGAVANEPAPAWTPCGGRVTHDPPATGASLR